MKKLFLIFAILFSCMNLFSSTGVTDYGCAVNKESDYYFIDEVYVVTEKSLPVKESPFPDSKTICRIQNRTPVKVLAISEDLKWAGIYIPYSKRISDSQIGWIKADLSWQEVASYWNDDFSYFSTDKWKTSDLKTYLENSLWYFEKEYHSKIIHGIISFEEARISGFIPHKETKKMGSSSNTFETDYFIYSSDRIGITRYDKLSKALFSCGSVDLSISETHFSFKDGDCTYTFERINPMSVFILDTFNDENLREAFEFAVEKAMYGFKLYQKGSKYQSIFDAYYKMKDIESIDKTSDAWKEASSLLSVAINYGVYSRIEIFKEHFNFWKPHCLAVQENCKKGIYEYSEIRDSLDIIRMGRTYRNVKEIPLYKEEASSDIEKKLKPYTEVKIIDIGKPDLMEGIISNWVKVSFSLNGKNHSGWIFAGYITDN